MCQIYIPWQPDEVVAGKINKRKQQSGILKHVKGLHFERRERMQIELLAYTLAF
jgi:hypothetical protein